LSSTAVAIAAITPSSDLVLVSAPVLAMVGILSENDVACAG
jgi:hypothetical protein